MLRLYGSKISYYTGKLEAYLQYKEIPFEFVVMDAKAMRRTAKETGAQQMPAVELPDGRFMTDTTPMIAWFESQHPEPAVIPRDPLQACISRFVEDYAEEWLWRPAMHYRWSYAADRGLLSRVIVDELLGDVPLPAPLKRAYIRRRQLGNYVKRDGVSAQTWDHVEDTYFRTLAQLEAVLAERPFLLGARPSLADFGFMAPMFRHFGQDPTASELMRARAPGVFAWQARVWNARASHIAGDLEAGIPAEWGPILDEIGRVYLPYLCMNAEAWQAGARSYDFPVEGVTYRDLPTSPYRVWCLEELRRHAGALQGDAAAEATALLTKHGCWEPLFRLPEVASGYDPDGQLPFHGGRVFPKRFLD